MTPQRRPPPRLVVSLAAALVLASALVYTSFSASSEARSPSQLRDAAAGRAYQLTGRVMPGYRRVGDVLVFRVRDRTGASTASVPVRYAGAVPDPFRAGREVIVTVRRRGGVGAGALRGRGPRPVPGGAGGDRRGAPRGRFFRRQEGPARHEVPVEVQRREARPRRGALTCSPPGAPACSSRSACAPTAP